MATTIKKAAPKPLPKSVQLTAKPEPDKKSVKAPKEYGAGGETLDPADNPESGVEVSQGVAHVNTKFKDGTETDEHIPVGDAVQIVGPKATVGMTMAMTRNLGNYESVKMSVSLVRPCPDTPEDLETTYTEVKEWVDTKINALNEEINEQLA